MEELIKELKQEIIEALNLEEMTPDDIDENDALFGDGLGLDSIDALELIVLLEKKYGIKLSDPAKGKEIFKSVSTIADYVDKNKKKIKKIKKTMEELIKELKQEIIEALNLEEMTPDDIDENDALFGDGLGLDSIDALELIVLLEKKYGIKLSDPAKGKEIFKSVSTIADYVDKNRKK